MYFLTGFCVAYYALLIRVLHMNPRYGLALLAILCILCGYVADRLVSSRLLVVRWSFQCGIFLSLCMNTVWPIYFALPVMSVVMGSEPRDHFLQTREGNYRMFQFVKQSLPIEAKLLLQGIVRGFYCDRAYIWDHPYQRLLNYGEFEKPSELLARMRELGISHVARMIRIPPGRTLLGYPQYFADNFHESFRKSYLRPIYRDESYVLFEVVYPNGT
jgi:hypothetical protein